MSDQTECPCHSDVCGGGPNICGGCAQCIGPCRDCFEFGCAACEPDHSSGDQPLPEMADHRQGAM